MPTFLNVLSLQPKAGIIWCLPIGKKAVEYFRQRGIECLTDKFAEIAGISVADCFEIANLLCEEFRKGTLVILNYVIPFLHLCFLSSRRYFPYFL